MNDLKEMSTHSLLQKHEYLNAFIYKRKHLETRMTYPTHFRKRGPKDRKVIPMSEDFNEKVIELAVSEFKKEQEEIEQEIQKRIDDGSYFKEIGE